MITPLLSEKVRLIVFILPIPITIILYYILVKVTSLRWKAIHRTVEFSVSFYLLALILFIERHLDVAAIGVTLIILLLILSIHLIIQWRKETEVLLLKGLKMVARICFILSALFYLLFVTYEVIIFSLKQIA